MIYDTFVNFARIAFEFVALGDMLSAKHFWTLLLSFAFWTVTCSLSLVWLSRAFIYHSKRKIIFCGDVTPNKKKSMKSFIE